jgi:hypothetical protein
MKTTFHEVQLHVVLLYIILLHNQLTAVIINKPQINGNTIATVKQF